MCNLVDCNDRLHFGFQYCGLFCFKGDGKRTAMIFILKTIGFILLLGVLGIGGWYFWASADSAPTQQALAKGKANLPSLIPVRDLYANMDADWNYKPSFDGSLLAWYSVSWGRVVVKIGKPGETAIATLPANIGYFVWSAYENALDVVQDGRLWRIDPENPDKSNWTDITPRGFQSWDIASFPQNADDRFVIVSRDRIAEASDLYTVRADGSDKQLLVRNEGNTLGWVLDDNHKPVIRINNGKNDVHSHQLFDQGAGQWHEFASVQSNDTLIILHAPKPGGPIEAISNRGRDKLALVDIDSKTGDEIVTREEKGFDIRDVLHFDDATRTGEAILYYDGYPKLDPLTERGKRFVALLDEKDGPASFEIMGMSGHGRFVTVAKSVRNRPYAYYLFDLKENKAVKLGEAPLSKYKDTFAETKPVTFKARDGLEIPALLTLPRGVPPKDLPTIDESAWWPCVE